jgi:hypothetical protein
VHGAIPDDKKGASRVHHPMIHDELLPIINIRIGVLKKVIICFGRTD